MTDILISGHWRCVVLKARRERSLTVSGGYGEGETPLPIPNRAVKPLSADGTWWATAWESRSPPVLHSRAAFGRLFFVPATPCSGRPRRGSSHAMDASLGSATRDGRRSPAGRRNRLMPHRRCGGPSPAPPIRAGDRVWDAGRSAGELAPPRLLAQGRTRQAWRSRSRGRHCRQLAGQGRCARGTWGQSTNALGQNICSARDVAGGPKGT